MATHVGEGDTIEYTVASDPKIEGYGNYLPPSPETMNLVASDPKIEGYGNDHNQNKSYELSCCK